MLRPGNVATPVSAVATSVPDNDPPLGLAPIAIVTTPVNDVARFPNASPAVTWTAGLNGLVAVVAEGCTVNASDAAAAGVTVTVAVWLAIAAPTVAETTLGPAAVELSAPVATPLASVGAAGCVTVFPDPVAERVTTTPGTGFPSVSLAVTVIAAALEPLLAVMVVGAATTVEAADAPPGFTVNGAVVSAARPDVEATRV